MKPYIGGLDSVINGYSKDFNFGLLGIQTEYFAFYLQTDLLLVSISLKRIMDTPSHILLRQLTGNYGGK